MGETTRWRILLVDDEAVILTVLEKALARDGHQVTPCATGPAAAERLRSERFDLLITDKNLPDLDGVELARLARAHSNRVGIVLVTGFASVESARELLGVADAYFLKPFDLRALKQSLAQIVERRARLPQGAGRPHGAAHTVVLAEPNAHARQRVQPVLERLGHQVTVEADLSALVGAPPDAVVLSSNACNEDNSRALLRLQLDRPELRIILLSPTLSIAESVRAIALGARGHVQLGMSDPELIESFRRWLGRERTITARIELDAAAPA